MSKKEIEKIASEEEIAAQEEIEQTLKNARKTVEDMKTLQRLSKNKDFIDIIKKGYLEEEALRYVNILTEPQIAASPQREAAVVTGLKSISDLNQYFISIERSGREAEDLIQEIRESMVEK